MAVTRPIANKGSKLLACCQRARRHGVKPGMVQAEALSILPSLTCVAEDLDADRQVLQELAEWSVRFSPIVGLEEAIAPTCLLIDTTGCAACFGGEESLVGKAREEFHQDGWNVTIALADTIGAAWALAHYLPSPQRGEGSELFDLPTAALRLSASTVALLGQLGIERIGPLAELPRDQVAERFGAEVGLRLDQALGQVAEVISPFHAQPEAVVSWAFEEPVERQEIVAKVLDLLLARLQTILQKRHCGARLVECVLEQEDLSCQRFECSLSRPACGAEYLGALMRTRLEQVRVQAPIRAMCVRAVVLQRLAEEQPGLFEDETEASTTGALAELLDSLASRLGASAVTRARFVPDPQPELACCFESALEPGGREPRSDDARVLTHRPLRMFRRPIPVQVVAIVPPGTPQRFHYGNVDQGVVRCQGPERIETGWWRGNDIQRDYFMVETAEGTRWWLFQRIHDGRWFLHGCFE